MNTNTVETFADLGKFLSQFVSENPLRRDDVRANDEFFADFEKLIMLSQSHNGWFTPAQVRHAIGSWAQALTEVNLEKWLSAYDLSKVKPRSVGLILAGNIPLVGFHDLLSVLLSGHSALVRLSSNDQKLVPFLAGYLIAVNPELKSRITFTEGRLAGFDAVIATGSNNTSRYFEYYFKDVPSIIRKNRNSVAVLTGNETKGQLHALGEDIFRYFGLGCRNVSKLFVPDGYNFDVFFEAVFDYKDVIHYEKYANNYDYNKAVFLMSNFKLLDNGFLTIKQDASYASPISSVFYEYYADISAIAHKFYADKDVLQCIVSDSSIAGSIPFGTTQSPELWDYADGIDTMQFLAHI